MALDYGRKTESPARLRHQPSIRLSLSWRRQANALIEPLPVECLGLILGDYALVENPLLGHNMIKKVKRVF